MKRAGLFSFHSSSLVLGLFRVLGYPLRKPLRCLAIVALLGLIALGLTVAGRSL